MNNPLYIAIITGILLIIQQLLSNIFNYRKDKINNQHIYFEKQLRDFYIPLKILLESNNSKYMVFKRQHPECRSMIQYFVKNPNVKLETSSDIINVIIDIDVKIREHIMANLNLIGDAQISSLISKLLAHYDVLFNVVNRKISYEDDDLLRQYEFPTLLEKELDKYISMLNKKIGLNNESKY